MGSGLPRNLCPNVQNCGQMCMFRGKNRRDFRSFTRWSEVRSESLELMLELDSAADYVQFMQAISPSLNALLASQSTEQQERMWQAVGETVHQRYSRADGTVGLPGETICLVARC